MKFSNAVLFLASTALLASPVLSLLKARNRSLFALLDGLSVAWLFASCLSLALYAAGTLGASGIFLAILGFALTRLGSRFFPIRSTWSTTAALALVGAAIFEPPANGPILLEALAAGVLAHFLLSRPEVMAVELDLDHGCGSGSEPKESTCNHGHGHSHSACCHHPAEEPVEHGCCHHPVKEPVEHGCCHHPVKEAAEHKCGHSHHEGTCCGSGSSEEKGERKWAASGFLVGLSLFVGMSALVEPELLIGHIGVFLRTFMTLALESSPALLIGYFLAGLVPLVLSPSRVSFLLKGGRTKQALRGVVFGLPLPICSCGILPIYESLVRKGVPMTAALAFLVATPELGLDAVLLSLPLLGSSLTWARVVSAFAVALLVALIVGRVGARAFPLQEVEEDDQRSSSLRERVREGLRFGFVEIFDHTMPWIGLGLVVAALVEPLLSHGALGTLSPTLQAPLAAIVGIPIYVCASGATPVVALALHKGLSAGAAVSFLIAGPATNLTTFAVLRRLHGKSKAILFGVSVIVFAILTGWTVDALGVSAKPILQAHGHSFQGSWLSWFCFVSLLAVGLLSLFRQGPRGIVHQIIEPIHAH